LAGSLLQIKGLLPFLGKVPFGHKQLAKTIRDAGRKLLSLLDFLMFDSTTIERPLVISNVVELDARMRAP
jgi:hypothetical protein